MKNKYKYIMDNLQYKYDYLIANGYKVLVLFLQGSQNYGLDIYDDDYKSDIDAKAIVLPTLRNIVLNETPVSTTIVLPNNEHIEVKDIRIMKDMFIKQNISYIELLYTKYYIANTDYESYVKSLIYMRDDISNINKNQFLRCIKGMSMEKYKALEHPYPTLIDKIEKFGYDPKQLHHIMRLNEFVKRYLIHNEKLKDCYWSRQQELLIEVKKGKYDLDTARTYALNFDKDTKELCDRYITNEEYINGNSINELNNWVMNVITKSLEEELID